MFYLSKFYLSKFYLSNVDFQARQATATNRILSQSGRPLFFPFAAAVNFASAWIKGAHNRRQVRTVAA